MHQRCTRSSWRSESESDDWVHVVSRDAGPCVYSSAAFDDLLVKVIVIAESFKPPSGGLRGGGSLIQAQILRQYLLLDECFQQTLAFLMSCGTEISEN